MLNAESIVLDWVSRTKISEGLDRLRRTAKSTRLDLLTRVPLITSVQVEGWQIA